jgi:hypothetical protein
LQRKQAANSRSHRATANYSCCALAPTSAYEPGDNSAKNREQQRSR